MSSPSSPPLPFLPTEVKKEILKFCDQPTLAKTSTLSLAFLQLSSPLLYRHIVFEGPGGLTKILTIVAEERHPELDPWLDLSLVHSVIYIDDEDHPFNSLKAQDASPIEPHRLRLPSSSTPGRLPLHSLKVILLPEESDSEMHHFFDPVEFELTGVLGGETSFLEVDLSSWTRLRRLVFVDALFHECLMESRFQVGTISKLDVSYDLSESFSSVVADWIEADLNVEEGDRYAQDLSCIEKVSVLLKIEEDKRDLLECLTRSLLLPRITVLVRSSTETPPIDVDTA